MVGPFYIVRTGGGGVHNDGQIPVTVLTDALKPVKAIVAGHINVQKYDVKRLIFITGYYPRSGQEKKQRFPDLSGALLLKQFQNHPGHHQLPI